VFCAHIVTLIPSHAFVLGIEPTARFAFQAVPARSSLERKFLFAT